MSEGVSQVNQNIQVIVSDTDISKSSISTVVEQLESAIWMATLKALDEDAAEYLNTLVLGETVQVKMVSDSNPPLSVNWLTDPTVVTVFVGTVQELSPIMTEEGQTCGVVAYGNGFQFKQLRIVGEFGNILPVPNVAPAYTYDGIVDNWSDSGLSSSTGLFGNKPYISKYSGLVFLVDVGQEPTYIACSLSGNINSTGCKTPTNPSGTDAATVGAWNFNLSPDYIGGEFAQVELHIVACISDDKSSGSESENNHADTVIVTPYWTIDEITWYPFTNGSFVISQFTSFDVTIGSYWNNYSGGEYGPTTIPEGLGGVEGGTYGPYIPPIWTTYQPLIYQYTPPQGQDIPLNILPELPVWNSAFKVKLCITGSTGAHATSGNISIAMMYLYVDFNKSSGFTINQLITGKNLGIGVVPNFVNNSLPDSINPNGFPSQYSPNINTDYVVQDDPTNVMNLISYIKFPYEDCLTAIQDIVKYGSALQFLQGNSGYHWIVDVLGHLIVAPSTNHNVYGGPDNTNEISSVWTLQPYTTPLKVKVDMISQQFKIEPPVYNYIYVCGVFQYPLNDDFFRNSDISMWLVTNKASFPPQYTSADGTSSGIYGSGSYGTEDGIVKFTPYTDLQTPFPTLLFLPANDSTIVYLRPFNTSNPVAGAIDFTKLMGKETVPTIEFWLRTGGGTGSYKLKLYVDNGNGTPKLDSWFENVFGGSPTGQDNWGFVSIQLPNSLYQRDYNGWQIKAASVVYGLEHSPMTLDWSDLSHIAYFGIEVTSAVSGFSEIFGDVPYFQMYGWYIYGTVLRAVYDSLSINGGTYNGITYLTYGCRMTTIKDTFAQTDTLSSIIDKTDPLTLEAIYDLQRYHKVRTTGSITIPLNPVFTAGQQVWIQAEETIPNGFAIHTGSGSPTITIGNVGDYYVNISGSTKDQYGNYNYPTYILTSITSGPTYHWTATGLNQYKINKWMRITKCTHSFNVGKAVTTLQLTDDLNSSLTVDTRNVYTTLQRAVNPDFQSKTLGSLKSKDDFDLGLVPIAIDMFNYMTVVKGMSVQAFVAL